MNTPPEQASARVFLRLLRDALFSGPGSADLLLPRWRLSRLWPEPAAEWLKQAGASIRLASRVDQVTPSENGWHVDGDFFDGVVLACTPSESARLVTAYAPKWACQARELEYEPIVTIYAYSAEARLPHPMMALHSDNIDSPAQFVFDLGITSEMEGVLAFVISGATPWLSRGNDSILAATIKQGQKALGKYFSAPLTGLRCIVEKRATFLCTPHLSRPLSEIMPGLSAAGDYVDGAYPATLEGAMRCGVQAAMQVASVVK